MLRQFVTVLVVCLLSGSLLVAAQDCVITPKPFPQVWQLWSQPTRVDGCDTNGQALAWLTLTESGHNMDINLVQSVGTGARMTITNGQGGPVMFEIISHPDGTGEGTYPSISDENFNIMVSDGAWLNIANDACPDGALQGQIKITRCPLIPVSAHLTSDQVVPPWATYPNGHGIMVGEWNPQTHELNMITMHLMTTEIIAAGLFGPAREGDNGAGVNAYMFELSIAGQLTTDKIILSLEQEVMMWQGLIFQQIQDRADLHIRGQLMVCDCFDCRLPTVSPTPEPPREPCVPVTRPEPQVWMLWSMPLPVAGCDSGDAQALARLTLTEEGHNMDIILVHDAGNATGIMITDGPGGAVLFEVQPSPDGTGQGAYPSLTQEQFDLMTTDRGWLTISTASCPDGALGGRIEIVQCPNVPVSAHLLGSEVVAPWTVYEGGVGLMVGTWNPSSHHLQIRTMHLLPTRIIAHALFGPARRGENPSNVNPQIELSLPEGPMSTDNVGLTFEMEPMLYSGLMFQQIQDLDDKHIRGQISTYDCWQCVQPESTPSPGPPDPADLLPPRNAAGSLHATISALVMMALSTLLALALV